MKKSLFFRGRFRYFTAMNIRAIGRIGSSLLKQVHSWLDSFACLLWPPHCRICHSLIKEDHSLLCRACWQQLSHSLGQHYCRRCGRTVSPYGLLVEGCGHCFEEHIIYDGILRVGLYESVLRDMILHLKFREVTEFTGYLGDMLRSVFEVRQWTQPIDYLVPVPLHWRRRLERGFNQSFLLARSLSVFQIPVCLDLVRIRYTRRQWDLTPAQRRRNVKGAFAVRRDHPFAGKTVCLVDDITTSGATLNECAKTLKRAGAENVYSIVLAVAEAVD